MNRLSSLLVLCAVVLAPFSTAVADAADTVYPVAILPFAERGSDVKDLGPKVTDLMFASLAAEPSLLLVDRADIQAQLDEQELNLSGMVNPAEATQVGHLTGAKILVTGSVLQIDKSLYLIAKIIGTETSRVVGAKVRGGVRDDLGNLAEQLAEQVGKTISQQGGTLVAKPRSRDDRIADLREKLKGRKRPAVLVDIPERHVGQMTIDPAAETELMLLCRETGFTVVDPEEGREKDADVLIRGEGFSEFATRRGNLVSVKARLEVKAIDRATGELIAIDRQTSIAVDLSEQIAGKTALQQAAATLAERILPKLAKGEKK